MTTPIEQILDELRPRLPDWYPDVDLSAPLAIEHVDERQLSTVARVLVSRIDAEPVALIIKVGWTGLPSGFMDRPRLAPVTTSGERLRMEFEALTMVAARMEELDDPKLGAIRALGILPGSAALVMEVFPGRPMQRILARGPLERSRSLRPTRLAWEAGRWLRVFHDMPIPDQPVRQGTRQDLADAFTEYGAHLAGHTNTRDLASMVQAGIDGVARMPDPLPLSQCHGDFAPRNVLVDADGRLAVIDLLIRWQAPRYEDIAGFLVALDTSRANAATRGLLFGPAIERLKPAFLAGYFGPDPIPSDAIRVYELLLVLDKWSARTTRQRSRRGLRGVRERLIDGHFHARSRHLARELRGWR
jgi:aminoglycoside phosphotransferase